VFVKGKDGKISVHKLFWQAYWGIDFGGEIEPLLPGAVKEIAGNLLKQKSEPVEGIADWRPLSLEKIGQVLKLLAKDSEGEPVYIGGGKMYRLVEGSDEVEAIEHEAARAYSWPIAHDVRPATQSLGVSSCKDCHTTDSGFFFGKVLADSAVISDQEMVEMVVFEDLNKLYTKAFAFSFVFRPWLKAAALCSCALIAFVLLFYGLRALGCLAKAVAEED
jgi:hypothetical protein